MVGVGDLISLVETLVGVVDLINYVIVCIFVDLVGVGDLKIPAVQCVLRPKVTPVLGCPP